MTEKQKKIAIIAGTVILALILLLSRKGSNSGTTIVNKEEMPGITVNIPGFNIPQRGDINISIPALPSASPYGFSAISPCMCNGAGNVTQSNGPLIEFVTNQGARGGNTYNYTTQQYTPQYNNAFIGVPG